MPHTTGDPNTGRPAAAAGHWVLDPAKSAVRFSSRTFWGMSAVKGEFTRFGGSGEVLPEGQGLGTLTVEAASLETGHAKRDTHLRSADFFSAREHPEFTFAASSITPDGSGDAEVTGELSIRGTALPMAFAVRISDATAEAVTLDAELHIDRKDFGMVWNRAGMLRGPATVSVTARFTHRPA